MASGNTTEPIKEYTINNLNDYLECIKILYNDKSFQEKDGNNVFFFRGYVNDKWELLPNVFRENKKVRERGILLNYRDHLPRSVHNARFDFVKDRIEILAEMQHYTIPTRLLDWTMSPLIALYFAVRAQDINKVKLKEGGQDEYESPNKKLTVVCGYTTLGNTNQFYEKYVKAENLSLTTGLI